ncbi:uncharacterized protein Tco025E_10012, partial [Trypanosoma conorhini]
SAPSSLPKCTAAMLGTAARGEDICQCSRPPHFCHWEGGHTRQLYACGEGRSCLPRSPSQTRMDASLARQARATLQRPRPFQAKAACLRGEETSPHAEESVLLARHLAYHETPRLREPRRIPPRPPQTGAGTPLRAAIPQPRGAGGTEDRAAAWVPRLPGAAPCPSKEGLVNAACQQRRREGRAAGPRLPPATLDTRPPAPRWGDHHFRAVGVRRLVSLTGAIAVAF